MISRQIKKFDPCAEITDKELYEHGEEMALRRKWTQDENIDGLDLQALDYILFLDRQVYCQIRKDIETLIKRVDDTAMHYKEVRDYRDGLLEQMKCAEDATHFEDYMNPPQESREPDPCEVPDCEGNYNCPFDSMFGVMLTPNGTYADTDSVIDGRDKTLCMYDVYEEAIGFKRLVGHYPKDGKPWISSQE